MGSQKRFWSRTHPSPIMSSRRLSPDSRVQNMSAIQQLTLAVVAASLLACGRLVTTGESESPSDAGGAPRDAIESAETRPEPRDVAQHPDAWLPVSSDASSDAYADNSAFRLDEHSGVRLQVVSDSAGDAIVMWEAGWGSSRRVRSLYWDAQDARWTDSESFDIDQFFLLDPHGSRFPAVIWSERVDAGGDLEHRFMRRFDPEARRWGPPVQQPDPPEYINTWDPGIDPAGNIHSFWRNAETNKWSFWRVEEPTWGPVATFDHEYLLQVERGGTFLRDDYAFGVRRFDTASGTWSDQVDLLDPANRTPLQIHVLAVGTDGSALGVTSRGGTDRVVVEARRFDPTTQIWGPTESVMSVPTTSDASVLYGPGAFTTGPQSFAWVTVPTADAGSEVHLARYDAQKHEWAPFRVFDGVIAVGDEWFQLCADEIGNVYGMDPIGLVRVGADGIWRETADQHASKIKAGPHSAFAAGWDSQSRLWVLKSDRAGDWVPTRGLPEGAHADVGSVPYAVVTIGENRALVVWTVSYGPDEGLWASFVE